VLYYYQQPLLKEEIAVVLVTLSFGSLIIKKKNGFNHMATNSEI
jgi:hypothetical protein